MSKYKVQVSAEDACLRCPQAVPPSTEAYAGGCGSEGVQVKFEYEKSMTREAALEGLVEQWKPSPAREFVPLDQAFGRVLAQDAIAQVALPVVRSSRMDGIAVRSEDFAQGAPDTSMWKRGVDFAQADTGDDFPDEFDAVVAIERVVYCNGVPTFPEGDALKVEPGMGVNKAGAIVSAGFVIAQAGTRLTPELVAACAVGGLAQVGVLRRPLVGFMATGSELVPWGSYPQRGQNLEANSLLVRGMLEQWGANCVAYPVVRDDPASLEAALDRALEACDIVMINGGSSRGEEDFNSQLIERRASYFAHGVRAVPGRPVGMGIVGGKPVVNIPGPVMAASLCMDWLIRGLVAHYYGAPAAKRPTVRAVMGESLSKPCEFERIARVRLEGSAEEGYVCFPLERSLGTVASIVRSDGQLVVPIGVEGVAKGEQVEVQLFEHSAQGLVAY